MSTTSLTLLKNVTDGTPSGNYDGSSLDWYSDPVRGVAYYLGQGHTQTIWIRVTDFSGLFTFEATLDTWPEWSDLPEGTVDNPGWFEVARYGDEDPSTAVTDFHVINVQGNFTWLRVRVENFVSGTIDDVYVTY